MLNNDKRFIKTNSKDRRTHDKSLHKEDSFPLLLLLLSLLFSSSFFFFFFFLRACVCMCMCMFYDQYVIIEFSELKKMARKSFSSKYLNIC